MFFLNRNKSSKETLIESTDSKEMAKPPTTASLAEIKEEFKHQHGVDLTDDLLDKLKKSAQVELKTTEGVNSKVSPKELVKLKESLHLCETRRENIKRTLAQIRYQLNWYKDFVELTRQVNDSKNELYRTQKDQADAVNEAQLLLRYDALIPMMGHYRCIINQREELQASRNRQSEVTREIEIVKSTVSQLKKQSEISTSDRERANLQIDKALPQLQQALQITGRLEELQKSLAEREQDVHLIEVTLVAVRKELADLIAEHDELNKQKEENLSLMRSLEAHAPMIDKVDSILIQLVQLQELAEAAERYKTQLDENQYRKNEEVEICNRLNRLNQEYDNQLTASKLEQNVHVQANKEKDGGELQRKLSALHLQLQDLKNASRIWDRITEEYELVEEKEQAVIRLQMRCDNIAAATQKMDIEVAKLREQHEKAKYAYTLSKSDDVAKLRSDLKEGTACSVCGATHHPYHSESEQESGKLISELKLDYEHFMVDIRVRERELEHAKMEHLDLSVRLEMEQGLLSAARRRVELYRAEWMTLESLDHLLIDSSRTINRDTRKVLLQQLIERASRDIEQIKKGLESFNFHQININRTTNQINSYTEKKRENSILLANANSARQTFSFKVEELQANYEQATERYNELYQTINRMMTISTWFKEWTANNDGFKEHLLKMRREWLESNQKIARIEKAEIRNSLQLELLKQAIKRREKKETDLRQKIEQTHKEIEQNSALINATVGSENHEEYFKKIFNVAKQTDSTEKQHHKKHEEAQERLSVLTNDETRCNELIREQEMKLQALYSQLDIWLHQFNANNPPAQWSELQRLFEDKRDWNILRRKLNELQNNVLIAQHDADKARNALAEHQAKVMRPEDKGEESRESLQFRQESLEKELHELTIKRASILARMRSYDEHEALLQKR